MIQELPGMIKVLFKRTSIERILQTNENGKIFYDDIESNYLQDLMLTYYQQFSDTEIHLQIAEVQEQLLDPAERDRINVFELMFYYIPQILTFHENKVSCKYNEILTWNDLSKAIGEDLPVLVMLVMRNLEQGSENQNFSWPPVIGHNNTQLNKMLKKGMADNHFHLRGSSPYEYVSWINLMNYPNRADFSRDLDRIEENYRDKNKKMEPSVYRQPFRVLALQAALIRIYLCSRLNHFQIKLAEYAVDSRIVWENVEKHEDIEALASYLADKLALFQSHKIRVQELFQNVKRSNRAFSHAICFFDLFADILIDIPDDIPDAPKVLGKIMSQLFENRPLLKLEQCHRCLSKSCWERLWHQKTLRTVRKLLINAYDLECCAERIQGILDSLFVFHEKMDYMLGFSVNKTFEGEKDYSVLAGERWFVYQMLKAVKQRDSEFNREEFNLFYAYLRIKNEIRAELVQTNKMVGFENFALYQMRKDLFCLMEDFWKSERVLVRLAVRDILNNPAMKSLELRITPGRTAEENAENIREYDCAIMDDRDKISLYKRFYYVLHFPKQADNTERGLSELECRHYEFRNNLKRSAKEIIRFRKEYPQYARRVAGIDACAQEIGCRPEVFARTFRVLKAHSIPYRDIEFSYRIPQLKITYHAGEDFLDIVDGLRAIDEAIRFLQMDCGDRLGHALALGVDAGDWYRLKGKKIKLPLQDYLDNIVWMHHAILKYNITGMEGLMGWLEEKYSYYFTYIYQPFGAAAPSEAMRKGKMIYQGNFDINTYYYAWLLRGDQPSLYKTGVFEYDDDNIDAWNRYAVNKKHIRKEDIRYIPEVALLYYRYHYDTHARERGRKAKTFTIPDIYVKGVLLIQKR